MSTPLNPPAFPQTDFVYPNGNIQYGNPGMTLRDYFAAKAMAALLSNPASYDALGHWRQETTTVSEMAYEIADDMLAERNA